MGQLLDAPVAIAERFFRQRLLCQPLVPLQGDLGFELGHGGLGTVGALLSPTRCLGRIGDLLVAAVAADEDARADE